MSQGTLGSVAFDRLGLACSEVERRQLFLSVVDLESPLSLIDKIKILTGLMGDSKIEGNSAEEGGGIVMGAHPRRFSRQRE